MTKRDAEREIERLMAALWSGAWDPDADDRREPAQPEHEETFDSFALGWFERKRQVGGRDGRGLSPSGAADLAWALDHLRAWFGGFPLSAITTEEVERFAHAKRVEGGLSGTSVRKFVRVLRSILATAVRYERIPRNVAEGVVVPGSNFRGTALSTAAQVVALLDAAGEIDGERRLGRGHGRALLAVLTLGGLRVGEALALRWRDVDLAAGTLRIARSKTEAGEREVDVLPLLRDELLDLAARKQGEPDALVFGTSRGGKESASNVRNRLLRPAVERASKRLAVDGHEEFPERITPHSLRRTFASLLAACGEDPGYIADQLGHTDPAFTFRVYRRMMKRRDGERERILRLVRGDAVIAAAGSEEGTFAVGSSERSQSGSRRRPAA